jgi:hypothetical protein
MSEARLCSALMGSMIFPDEITRCSLLTGLTLQQLNYS